ncbi:MAG: capsule assembly Wzi family protein [Flavobacteriales bacterium]|jgi:hypothetical protein|nr:capsule assembly Wzi family protein [Flavobacteriales bacterium]
MLKKFNYFLVFSMLSTALFAQNEKDKQELEDRRINYNPQYLLDLYEKNLYSYENTFHTAIRPFRAIDLKDHISPEAVKGYYGYDEDNSRFMNILMHRDLIRYAGEKNDHIYDVRINPIMDFDLISETGGSAFTNTRGIQIIGQLGDRFHFYTDLRENLMKLPSWVKNESVNERALVVPGMGRPNHLTTNGAHDFSNASGYIHYKTKSFFSFEFGTGKNFIGEGHRSMILSDNAANYPYLKIQTQFGKVMYQNIFSKMIDVSYDPSNPQDKLHGRKYMAMHYFSINLGKRFNIGLFESIVWNGQVNPDGTESRGFEIAYLNPIIFYRSIEHSIGSGGGNALLGLTGSFKASERTQLYGQFLFDELSFSDLFSGNGSWKNKFAFQAGMKSFDLFHIENLNFRAELNLARPFTYSHHSGLTNYGHYEQEMAHPLGANFIEFLTQASYQYKRWRFRGQIQLAQKGYDADGNNNGSDIYEPNVYKNRPYGDFGNTFLFGNKASITNINGTIGYVVNPTYNLTLEAGIWLRDFSPEVELANFKGSTTTMLSFGLKTNLFPRYYDF